MNKQQIQDTVLGILATIAPDAKDKTLDPDISFHDQLEIDSIDFLRLMTVLEKELQVSIPDCDYPQLSTLKGCVNYLSERLHPAMEMAS
jgi:acyl carrier protein